jgi:hypothetical protein
MRVLGGLTLEFLLKEKARYPLPLPDGEFLYLAEGHRAFRVLLRKGPFKGASCFFEPALVIGLLEGHVVPSN